MYDLKGFRQEFKLTQNQVAAMFNCKQSNISGMEKSMRDLEPYQKEILVQKYGETAVNKYNKVQSNDIDTKSPSSIQSNAHAVEDLNYMNVPVVHIKARCGYLAGYADEGYIDSLPTMPVIVDKTYHGRYMIFEAEGDSMDDGTRNSICDGDKLLCREVRRDLWLPKLHINDWYFVIVHRTEGIAIKQITAQDENGNITCHSLNDLFNDYTVNLDDVAEIYNVIKVVERSMRL